MRRMSLAQLLSSQDLILLDGAMGTQLAEAGLEMGGQNSLSHPETVLDIHRRYLDCGVQVLITNTLTMNRVCIEAHGLKTDRGDPLDVRAVNLAGARLAREAAGAERYVLGNLSSTGQMLEPYGTLAEEDAYRAFYEQAAVLIEGGVDGLLAETLFDLREARCVLRACRAVTDRPVLVSIAFTSAAQGGRTLMGDRAAECARVLAEEGASAIGANCGGIAPLEMAAIVAEFGRATALPILVQPNAGKPRLVGEQTVFDMPPAEFAAGIRACVEAGARLVGGCCGTTPAHIRAVAEMLYRPPYRPPRFGT